MNNYCVYKHTSPSGKVYIGLTKHKNPKIRWNNGEGYKSQLKFYNAINKYGWSNFKHEILYKELSMKEAYDKELELIKKYNSTDDNFGYNAALSRDHLEKTKRQIGLNNSKKVICLNNGKVFNSIGEAAEWAGMVRKNGIIESCRTVNDKYLQKTSGFKRELGGYLKWMYYEEE